MFRPIAATALVASCALAGAPASAHVSAAPVAKPFAGQTITVAYASTPPPKNMLDQFKAQTGITVNWSNVGWDSLQTKITAAALAHAYLADVADVDLVARRPILPPEVVPTSQYVRRRVLAQA